MVDLAELTKFAKRYAEAWCSHVTGHLSLVTSLISGYELWKIHNDGLIVESKGHFDSAEYEHSAQAWSRMNLEDTAKCKADRR